MSGCENVRIAELCRQYKQIFALESDETVKCTYHCQSKTGGSMDTSTTFNDTWTFGQPNNRMHWTHLPSWSWYVFQALPIVRTSNGGFAESVILQVRASGDTYTLQKMQAPESFATLQRTLGQMRRAPYLSNARIVYKDDAPQSQAQQASDRACEFFKRSVEAVDNAFQECMDDQTSASSSSPTGPSITQAENDDRPSPSDYQSAYWNCYATMADALAQTFLEKKVAQDHGCVTTTRWV